VRVICAQRHPGTAPRLSRQKAGAITAAGNTKYKTVCLECQRLKTTERRQQITQSRPYGVIRLDWAPPQL
jgi:hypothetical protein